MLTTQPGPDVEPYHNRQVAVLPRDKWLPWLDGGVSAKALLGPCEAGTLNVERAG
jgi:putative SOS response-associated peptidase YedK